MYESSHYFHFRLCVSHPSLPLACRHRLQPVINLYLLDLRGGLGARICHEKVDIVSRVIFDTHLPLDHAPYVIDLNFPSLAILKHVSMRLPNDHMNRGNRSSEMTGVNHYELLIEEVVKKLDKLLL